MSDYRLGKRVEPIPVGDVVEDEYEPHDTPNGRMWRNTRTKQLRTDKPAPKVDPFEHMREVLRRAQQQQEDDGFPVAFWGVM